MHQPKDVTAEISHKSSEAKRIAVIGAGAAGLCAAKHLKQRGHDVTVYEMGSHIGGLWVLDNDNGMGPAYESLHLNSEKAVTAYKDFPFPDSTPIYPDHREVCAYLESYADTFGIRPLIRFNAEVAEVTRRAPPDEGWHVALKDGTSEDFDVVVVASGHQSIPSHLPQRDNFTGEYLHSKDYRVPEPFRDKRVLVVGMGNSAVDIAADVCVVTKSTTMSARSPVLIMPRMMFGVPTSRVLAKVERPWYPWPVKRRIRELLTWAVHGKMEQWGFERPKTPTHPTSHPNLMSHFAWNRIKAKPGVKGIDGQEVTFTDGSREAFDTIIAATGYQVTFPFLSDDTMPVEDGRIELLHRVVSPKQPDIFFVGVFNVSGGGNIRMMDDQAEWIGEIVDGEVNPPAPQEMRRAIAAEHERQQRRYPNRPRYELELDPREYRKLLSKERAAGRRRAESRADA